MATVESIHSKLVLDTRDFINGMRNAFGQANVQANDFKNNGARSVTGAFNQINSTIKTTEAWTSSLANSTNKYTSQSGNFKKVADSVKNINTEMKDISKNTTSAQTAISSFAQILGTIGIISIGKDIANIGMSFTTQLSRLQAATNSSKTDMKDLNEEAQKLGATTQFSASEAAAAMVELGKAGLKTNQIMVGTGQVLNLAAAGELSLADSASIAADTMAQFGLQAENIGSIADTLSASANNATISVRDVSESLKYVGTIAKSQNISLQTTAAMISIVGNAGIKASMAGTGLKGMLVQLASPSREAQKAMQGLGVQVSDLSGNMLPIQDIIEQFRNKMDGMGDTKKLDLLATIFGTEAAPTVLALINQGKDGIEKMTEAVSKYGIASDVASTQNDNLEGDLKSFNSALEGIKIRIFEAVLPALRSLVQGVNNILTSFNDWVKANPALSRTIFQLTVGISALVAVFIGVNGLMPILNMLPLALSKIGVGFTAMLGPIGLVVAAISGALFAFNKLQDHASKVKETQQNIETIGAADDFGRTNLIRQSDTAAQKLSNITNALEGYKKALDSTKGDAQKFSQTLEIIGKSFPNLADQIKKDSYYSDQYFASWKKAAQQIYSTSNEGTKKQTENTKNAIDSIKNISQNAGILVADIITQAKEQFKGGKGRLEFKIDVSKSKEEIDKAISELNQLGVRAIQSGETKEKKKSQVVKQEIEFVIPETTTKEALSKVQEVVERLNKEAKKYKLNIGDSKDLRISNPYFQTIEDLNKVLELEKELGSSSWDKQLILNLEKAKVALQSISKEFVNLLGSIASLKNVQFTNFKQNLSWIGQAVDKIISDNTNSQLEAIDKEIQAINDKNKEIERLEREHQENMQRIIDEFSKQRKEELDNEFNQRVALLNQEFQTKLDSLLANTSSQQEQSIITQQVEADRLNAIDLLKSQFDKKLQKDIDAKRAEEESKLGADKKKKEEEQNADMLKMEALENKKAEISRQAEQQKADAKRKSALIEWAVGRSAFEANKKAQVAQAQVGMMMSILSAIQAYAMIVGQAGIVGMPIGAAFLGLITGLSLMAGSNTMAAAQSQQYPPPPVFNSGGMIVPGMGIGDSVPAMLTPGELVIDRNTSAKIKDNVNGFGNNSPNINLTFHVSTNDPRELTDLVSQELFSRIERRFQSV